MAVDAMNRAAIAKRIALACGSLLVTILALEIGVRLFSPVPVQRNIPDFYVPDAHAQYALKPNAVRTMKLREFTYRMEMNSVGFRGPEFSAEPAPSITRVLLLGDSFTFGWGVDFDKTYGAVIERTLNRDSQDRRFEVINGGVPGYNTLNALRLFEARGMAVKPRYVILQLLVDDDVRDNLVSGLSARTVIDDTLFTTPSVEKARSRLAPGHTLTAKDVLETDLADAPARPLYERIKAGLEASSHLYRFAVERVPTAQVEQVKRVLRRVGFDIPQDDTETMLGFHMEVFERPRSSQIAQAVAVTEEYLRRLKSVADAQGARLVVTIFPTMFEVDPASRARLLARLDIPERSIDVDGVKDDLLAFCREAGIPAMALHPVVRARYSELRPYFPTDGHFNERGNQLAGETIADFLECLTRSSDNRCPAIQ
jgi:hypothetical protein